MTDHHNLASRKIPVGVLKPHLESLLELSTPGSDQESWERAGDHAMSKMPDIVHGLEKLVAGPPDDRPGNVDERGWWIGWVNDVIAEAMDLGDA